MSVLVVFAMAASAFAGPALTTNDIVEPPVMNASAEAGNRIFTVGTVELAISTLSPFTYTMADEYMVIFPVYSALLTLDENAEVIGDLATSWEVSPDGLTWTFEIVDNAYFINRTDPYSTEHPVTIDDVIFSYWLIQNYTSNLHFYFPGEIDGYPNTIESMTKINEHKMELQLGAPYAPFYNAVQSIPIFPQYWWEPRVLAAGSPGAVDVEDDPEGGFPIGSGFFYYDHDGLSPTETEYSMKKNPTWFQKNVRGWELNVDDFRLKECTDAGTAWLELKAGTIDCFMGVSPTVFVNDLPGTTDVIGYSQSTGFVYEFNLNQMTDELREQLGGSFNKGTNSQLLQDPAIKEAFAMCINKPGFISQVLLGLGTVATSLIPDINPWHYAYGTATGEVPVPFDTAGARELLWDNGWKYDPAGREVAVDSDQCPLYGYVDGVLTPLEFRFTTLNTEDEWLTGASLIKTWTAEAGFKLNLEAKSSSEMNSDWYTADYDIWLWNWIFSPVSDPSTDVLSVMTTQEIGSWSDCFWTNSTYDALYNESLVEMDVDIRRGIVNEMQAMLYEDAACQCVAYRDNLYAASLRNWQNYGNLEEHFMLFPDMTPTWLCLRIHPTDNWAPVVEVDPCFEGYVGESTVVSATIWDDDPLTDLEYRWFWGDGTSTDWIPGDSGESSHSYSEAGEYTAYVAAREASSSNGYDDYFMTSNNTTIVIYDGGVTWTLNLYTGWNLVSVPLVDHGLKASTLAESLEFLDSIHRWNSASQTYDADYLVGWSGPESDFDIEPSWAYWIRSSTAKSIEIIGNETTDMQIRPIVVPIGGGWVQVGLATLQTDLMASDLEDMYTPGQLESVHKWDAVSKMYYDYLVEWGMIDFPLSPGDGMWIKVKMSGVLYYDVPYTSPP